MSSHRSRLKKPSKFILIATAAGTAVVVAASTATAVAWPSGAPAHTTTTTADYLRAVNTPQARLLAKRTQAQEYQLSSAAQSERVAAAARVAAEKAAAERAAARKRAAARRAALLAAERAAEQKAQAAPATQAPAPAAPAPVQPSGSAQQIAMSMLGSYGWSSSQFSCLDSLWSRESGWNVTAENPDGAYGIPQAMPGSKMASAGPDWETNAATQIRWGLGYIKSRYGSPCGAWAQEEATGAY